MQQLPGSDDPLHEEPGAVRSWSRVNLAEMFPHVPTPLTWTLWAPVFELGFRAAAHALGLLPAAAVCVPAKPEDRLAAAVFFGHPTINTDVMKQVWAAMPGSSADAVGEQFLGERGDGNPGPPPATRRAGPVAATARLAAVGGRLVLMAAPLTSQLRRARREVDDWWRANTRAALSTAGRDAARTLVEAQQRLLDVMVLHGKAGILEQALYEQARRLAAAAGHPGLEMVALTGDDLDETLEVRALWQVARGARSLESFLDDFGFHSPAEGELSSRSWGEDPAPLEALLGRIGDTDAAARVAGQQDRRAAAERTLVSAVGPLGAARMRTTLRLARRFIRLRESAKASGMRVLDVARRAARVLGESFAAEGALPAPDDVFMLTFTEATTGANRDRWTGLVVSRRAKREAYERVSLPDSWVGAPEPLEAAGTEMPRPTSLDALGVSPGVVEGRARVVKHLDGDTLFEEGEILVCPTTDPTWASLMMLSSGVVIDMGGALSHGAVVARELGIPCVINAREATRAFRSGDLVRVDGTAGTVELLEAADAPAPSS